MTSCKQLPLAEIFTDCQEKLDNDKPAFLFLLETHINIDETIPISFRNHLYASTGRTRKYSLQALLWTLTTQRIFSIPTDQLLLVFLTYPKSLRDFYGFDKVPDASKITRFKQDFLGDLQPVLEHLVSLTEPICQAIDFAKTDITILDFSGIKAFVIGNNPRYVDRIIKQLKACVKSEGYDKSYDLYKAVYGAMPSHTSVNPEIKQPYIDGYSYYVFKFGIVTDGLGITRHIPFYNEDFIVPYPDIVVEKKTDSPDEDKSVHDSKLPVPTSRDLSAKHPLTNPKVFLGDAVFDSAQLYRELLSSDTSDIDKHFSKAYTPSNSHSHLENIDYTINDSGVPCCPHDPSLPTKPEGNTSRLRYGLPASESVCPKMEHIKYEDGKYHRRCQCDNSYITSPCRRAIYIYPGKDLRAFPGTIRGTREWDSTYKIRTVVEWDINCVKANLCLTSCRTQNENMLHADLILTGITQLITVVLADKTKHHEYIRSLKPLIA